MIYVALTVAAVVVGLALWPASRARPGARLASLEARYLRLLQMPKPVARETLRRTLLDMEQRFPGRSTTWHLRKMIADLERDRR
jgi:hypothetical protein